MDATGYLRSECPDYPAADLARAASAHRKRQFLEGGWREQLATHGSKQLGALRARLVGEWDTSSNLLKSLIEQTCTMFDQQPIVSPSGPLATMLDDGGWWTMARQHQQYVRALHESAVHVGWDPEIDLPTFELVTPDFLTIDASPYNRTRPVTVWWARTRTITGGNGRLQSVWFWDRWSIESGTLEFSIWSNDRTRDLTGMFPDAAKFASNTAGKLKDEKGKPLLPFALFHDRGSAQGIWSPVCRDSEIEFGTLQVGLLRTAVVHGVLRASWSQRVILNGKVKGGTTETVAGYAVRVVQPDPTAVLQIDGETASIAEWSSPLDIEKAERFLRSYENGLAIHVGLSPADVSIESMSPSSGAALTVSMTGKRTIAARDSIHFARGIGQLYEIVAATARANGVACSARNVRTRYFGVALTIDERVKLVPVLAQEIDLRLSDRVSAYQEVHPGTSIEDAQADLDAQDKRRMLEEDLAAASQQQPGNLPPPQQQPGPDAPNAPPTQPTAPASSGDGSAPAPP
jgi:hypothetical protein